MTLSFKLSLFLFFLFILGDKSLSLTDYQIRKFCKNEKRESTCIRILQEKKSDLQKGDFIEIPVIPYKR